jgi:hypothetical protein
MILGFVVIQWDIFFGFHEISWDGTHQQRIQQTWLEPQRAMEDHGDFGRPWTIIAIR